jgi:cation transport ATPase
LKNLCWEICWVLKGVVLKDVANNTEHFVSLMRQNMWTNVTCLVAVAGIMGFALVYAGKGGVLWAEKDTDSFPPVKGVLPIVLSWFISPLLAAAAAALIFFACRTAVLRRPNSYNMSFYVLPVAVFITTWINMYFIFTKGLKKTLTKNEDSNWTDSKAAWISVIIAAILAILTAATIPFLKKRITAHFASLDKCVALSEYPYNLFFSPTCCMLIGFCSAGRHLKSLAQKKTPLALLSGQISWRAHLKVSGVRTSRSSAVHLVSMVENPRTW